jgi:fumarate reductase iron-sulfur subunit
MKIKILRSLDNSHIEYDIGEKFNTLLGALNYIKSDIDNTLTFGGGCRASICGTCSVRVNEKEVLACEYRPKDGDIIEPLNYHKVLRDLKVDKNKALDTLIKSSSYLHQNIDNEVTQKDVKLTQTQSDCILCSSCFSACPVFAVNEDFIGPFALSRVYRYNIDPREDNKKDTIDNIQTNGVWDCTLCGECTMACPKGIDPKTDIMMLRGVSVDNGYSDPSFSNMSFGLPDFTSTF